MHGLLLNYGNARHTTLNYNTAGTLPFSVAVLTHYALLHSANSGRVDHCWRARHCGAAPVVGTRGRSGQREGRASLEYRTVRSWQGRVALQEEKSQQQLLFSEISCCLHLHQSPAVCFKIQTVTDVFTPNQTSHKDPSHLSHLVNNPVLLIEASAKMKLEILLKL